MKCDVIKDLSNFGVHKTTKDGHTSWCKAYFSVYKKRYDTVNHAKVLEYAKQYSKDHPPSHSPSRSTPYNPDTYLKYKSYYQEYYKNYNKPKSTVDENVTNDFNR